MMEDARGVSVDGVIKQSSFKIEALETDGETNRKAVLIGRIRCVSVRTQPSPIPKHT